MSLQVVAGERIGLNTLIFNSEYGRKKVRRKETLLDIHSMTPNLPKSKAYVPLRTTSPDRGKIPLWILQDEGKKKGK